MKAVRGVNVAAVTARREGPELDIGTTFELIDFLCSSGVNGIALLGSTGEFVHFEVGERIRLVMLAVKRSRVPVIAGIGHSTLDGAIALGREAADAGAAALLLMPPYFFRYSQDEVREFYLRFAQEIRDTPVFLYNVPFFTTEISCETALDLLGTGLFAGIKDSSGNWDSFSRLLEARSRKGFTVLVGNDAIFCQARTAGADGVISGVACAVPELMLALDRAVTSGAQKKTELLQSYLREFIGWLDRFPVPVGIRAALAVRGLKLGPQAVPLSPRGQDLLAGFSEWFKGWLPAVRKDSRP